MEIVTFAALVALATKMVTFIKTALNRDAGAITQLASWAVGVLVAFLAAHAGLTNQLVIPGTTDTFGKLDTWSVILVGLALGSAGSLTYDAVGSRTWEPSLAQAFKKKGELTIEANPNSTLPPLPPVPPETPLEDS